MTEHVADESVDMTEDAALEAETDATLAPVLPDRADAPVSEVTERFLRAVIAQIPLERIEELHLFSPLRQSGVETGIAVVAARVPTVQPVVEVAPEPELSLTELETGDAVLDDTQTVDADAQALDVDDVVDDAELVDAELVDSESGDLDSTNDASVQDESVDAELVDGELVDTTLIDTTLIDTTLIDTELDEVVATETMLVDTESVDAVTTESAGSDVTLDDSPYREEEVIPDAVVTPIERHTVYTARYRLVQKGPERGKWEADVVAEADAPLITVEMVVRGVQRRAGEESEILRYSASQIARALRMQWPLPTPHNEDQSTSQASAA